MFPILEFVDEGLGALLSQTEGVCERLPAQGAAWSVVERNGDLVSVAVIVEPSHWRRSH